jgi:hypothetical protein
MGKRASSSCAASWRPCSRPLQPISLTPTPNYYRGPPIEQLLPLSLSWTTLLQKLAVAILPSWFPGLAAQQWIGTPIVLGRFPTRMKLLQLDAEATERLRQRCREEDTSVTAVVSAAVEMAIMRGAGEGGGQHRHFITPISFSWSGQACRRDGDQCKSHVLPPPRGTRERHLATGAK